ncbi:MAG: hypothetical protein ACREP1_12835 [Rhodanobacteraceae bacterium]
MTVRNLTFGTVLASVLLASSAAALAAQSPASAYTPTIAIPHIVAAPKIDGDLADAAWKQAAKGRFVQFPKSQARTAYCWTGNFASYLTLQLMS